MGAVWLGRDEVLGRAVALKRIGMSPGAESPDLQRAEREARLAARLSHPHVVAVFDLVEEGPEHWLVMEYVEGPTLAQLIRDRGALDATQAASLVAQAADGLAAAHAAGIVHRDVKPSNILVTTDGQVKLSDFGIARAEADPALTQTGLVTGSPAYLAPEVASGRTATDASDVWSLGATLFHTLSGRPPYEVGDNLLGALYRIVHEEPPRLPDAGWLGPLLEATMALEPAERWSMAQVRDFLQAGPGAPLPAPVPRRTPAVDEHGTQQLSRPVLVPAPAADPAPRRRRSMLPILVGVAIVALLTVIGLAIGFGGDDDPSAEPSDPGTSQSPGSTAPAAQEPTAQGMTAFLTDYLETAARDPETAYTMLTPAFQEESGGLGDYAGFWGNVSSVSDVEVLDADPERLTIRYHYTREEDGELIPDTPTLRLTFDAQDGTYLIDGEA
jgi:serine/threonine protein kinase